MHTETELVPYVPGRLEGSPMLVLAPHPDDEVFGCGGVLVQAVRSGTRIRVVVLTDGEAQGDAQIRRGEAREAARRLGLPEPEFWGHADRSLRPDDPPLEERLRALFLEEQPRVVLVPSPAEVHPDHRALALLVYRLLQTATPGSDLHGALRSTRLAAYEVSAVLRPNLVVDVSTEWEEVLAAAKAYESQVHRLPYIEVLEGMASARRLTLPAGVRRAEAYHVVDLRLVRTRSVVEWAAAQGPSAELESADGAAPLDVVVRTRNRPQLLRQALDSVRAQLHRPDRVVVVNDGGVAVEDVCAQLGGGLRLEHVRLDPARGRSAAAQVGLERATSSHVVFLDDDDLMLPDHLLVLGKAVASGVTAPYVDAVQGVWRDGGEGLPTPVARHRTFGGGFDPARFSLVNHIPLPCVAIPRELALDVGGFDPDLDLYEDWDLLLRLAQRTAFVHLTRVTMEYRTIVGGDGIIGANPPGSAGQLAALESIWRRHGLLDDPHRLSTAVMSLVAERDRATELARTGDEELLEERGSHAGVVAELHRTRAEVQRLEDEADGLEGRLAEEVRQRAAAEDRCTEIERELGRKLERQVLELQEAISETARLNELLEQIHSSRTWRLHALLERVRQRLGLR